MFVSFEGIDASGKATLSKILAHELGASLFSFPDYETPTGHLILGHLKRYWQALPSYGSVNVWPDSMDVAHLNAMVFQSLQLANRMEHATEISRLMAQGRHVVSDRYWASGVVYGGADGLDPKYLMRIHEHLPQPDLNLLMDIDVQDSINRRPERRDRYEEQTEMMRHVMHRYRALWREMAFAQGRLRWVKIDARLPVAKVSEQVMAAVEALKGTVSDTGRGVGAGSQNYIESMSTRQCPCCGRKKHGWPDQWRNDQKEPARLRYVCADCAAGADSEHS